MKDFIEKLKEVINSIKSIFSRDKNQTPVVNAGKPNVTSTQLEVPKQEVVPAPSVIQDTSSDQIDVSDPSATITSFLLKPVSDTNPKITVVTVGSDLARAEDVRIKIKDKDGKFLKINEIFNVGGVKRGNKLPGHKYGRFNFKPGPTADKLKESAPLQVSFYLELNGKRTLMTVMGKKFITVKDPTKRLDLK